MISICSAMRHLSIRPSMGSFTRNFSSSTSNLTKVAILGAAGGIGQPLSLLMKQSSLVSDLALYDIRGSPGVAADVSHVNTSAKCHGYLPDNNGLEKTLDGASIILLPAGVPRKPGMSRDDLFNTNASIVRDLATAAAKVAPKAHMLIIANPVNSTVPIVGEVYKKAGVFDPKRSLQTLDVVRASAFLSEIAKTSPSKTRVQVVGGHSGVTIGEAYKALVKRIQFGGDEVVQAKDGAGSATLSMAYAAAVFADSLLKALGGAQGIVEPTFVKSPHYQGQGVEYFASTSSWARKVSRRFCPSDLSARRRKNSSRLACPSVKFVQ
ncbi:malate dehydrogenase, NAD-dependent [Phakopsora pachyrhizi]|nr:malate dehydrogenase, NAD-dependent [Phakopsora pachyrhizi]